MFCRKIKEMYETTYEAQHFKKKEAFEITIVVNNSSELLITDTAALP